MLNFSTELLSHELKNAIHDYMGAESWTEE